MKFTIQRDQLIAHTQDVMKAISSKTTVPILTGMKIQADMNGITLTGSNSDISIKSFIPAEENDAIHISNIEPGSIIVQAKYFPEIIRKLPEEAVQFEADSGFKIMIRSGKAEFTLNGQDADEYPMLPVIEEENSFQLPSSILKNLIKQSVFAVSAMETRPVLTGVKLELQHDILNFTATDSHRLASRNIAIEQASIEFKSIVIPGKSLHELNKILHDTNEPVNIHITNTQILFRTNHLYFMSRLLDGNYPETNRLIPEHSKTVLLLERRLLLHTIDRASLLAVDDQNNVVKLATKDNQLLEITSNSPEIGRVSEEIPIQSIEGEPVKISFSSKYMLDALKAIEYDNIKIEFTGAMRPFIIKPANDDQILQLILPVRTY